MSRLQESLALAPLARMIRQRAAERLRLSARPARLSVALFACAALAACAAPQSNHTAPPSAAPAIPVPANAAPQPIAPIAPPPPAGPAAPNPVAAAAFATPAPAPAPVAPAAPAPAPLAPAVLAPAPTPVAGGVTHIVVPGDTVFSLGRRYGATPAAIQATNNLDAAFTIRVGQPLIIPTSGAAPAQPVPAAAPLAPPAPAAPVAPAAPSAGPLLPPVDGPIIGVFGQTAGGAPNAGVDIGAPAGSTVRAAADGTVVYISDPHPTVGSVILIDHGGGMRTVYGLVDGVQVTVGQAVPRGAPIARVAPARMGGEPMLHFEIRRGSEPVDPTPFLRGSRTFG